MAPTSFRMDSLLREMQEIEGARMRHAPLQGNQTDVDVIQDQMCRHYYVQYEVNYSHRRPSLAQVYHTVWLAETRFLTQNSLIAAPAVADLATQQNWASEFLDASTKRAEHEHGDWTEQFLSTQPAAGHMVRAQVPVESTQWAKDFLASNEHKEWFVCYSHDFHTHSA